MSTGESASGRFLHHGPPPQEDHRRLQHLRALRRRQLQRSVRHDAHQAPALRLLELRRLRPGGGAVQHPPDLQQPPAKGRRRLLPPAERKDAGPVPVQPDATEKQKVPGL